MTKWAMILWTAAIALSVPATAEDLTVRGSRTVDDAVVRVAYGDLQLAQVNHAEALRTRVQRAVRRGCSRLYGSTTPAQEWTCRTVAADAAEPQVERAIAAAEAGFALSATSVVLRLAHR